MRSFCLQQPEVKRWVGCAVKEAIRPSVPAEAPSTTPWRSQPSTASPQQGGSVAQKRGAGRAVRKAVEGSGCRHLPSISPLASWPAAELSSRAGRAEGTEPWGRGQELTKVVENAGLLVLDVLVGHRLA